MRMVNLRRRLPELLVLVVCSAPAALFGARGAKLAAAVIGGGLLGVATLALVRRWRVARTRTLAAVPGGLRGFGAAREYVVPAELPPPYGALVGRDDEVNRTIQYLTDEGRPPDAPRVVAVTGPAGVGKSAFAVEVAHLLADRYPDGQLLVRLDPELGRDTAYALSTFAAALSGRDERVPAADQERWFRERTRRLRLLTVIDHAGDLDDVGRLLPTGPGCAVIVTSREPVPRLPQEHLRVPLDPLGHDAGLALLATLVGAERVRDERDHADQILHAAAGYPAALDIAGAVLARRADWRLEIALNRMAEHPLPSTDDEADLPPFTRVLDLAFALLTEREQLGLRLLGLLETRRVAPWMLTALLQGASSTGVGPEPAVSGSEQAVAGRVLDRLAHARLTERRVDDETGVLVFRVPRYVQAYARVRARELDDPVREAAVRELLAERRRRGEQVPETVLRGTVYQDLHAGRLSLALERAREAAALSRDLRAAVRDGTVEASSVAAEEGLTLAALAEVYAELGWIEEGLAAVASALEDGKDSSRSRPRALRVKGTLRRRQHRIDSALQQLSEALTAARQIDDRPEEVRVLRESALALALSREPERGLQVIDEAKALCERNGDSGRRARPSVWFAWGCVLAACQRWEAADQVLQEAAALCADPGLGQQLWGPWIWYQRAFIAYQQQRYERCREQALSALEGFTEFQHRYGAAHCRLLIGRAHLAESALERATPMLEEAHRTLLRCGDRWIEADAAVELARAYLLHRRGREAVDLLTQAEQAFGKLGDTVGLAKAARLLWEVESQLPPEPPSSPTVLVDPFGPVRLASEAFARLVGNRPRE